MHEREGGSRKCNRNKQALLLNARISLQQNSTKQTQGKMLLYYSLSTFLLTLTLPVTTAQNQFSAAAAAAASSLPSTQKWPKEIEGTWSTKSLSTLTGPGFYDPINDKLIEPEHTGISYSFTSDGHYEEAYYRAIASPSQPTCPEGILQWQHGKYFVNATGSLFTQPIKVDGRQLLSNPCTGDNALFLRYNQSELFKQFQVSTDKFHNVPMLQMYEWDGTPMNPMYLVYSPPQMLPTSTLNPVVSGTATAAGGSTATSKVKKAKRSLEEEVPLAWKKTLKSNKRMVQRINADRLWWVGLGMTGVGGLFYLGPRRLGLQL